MVVLKDKPEEKCGVFGVFGVESPAEYIYLGLHTLQHRGQETAKIVTASNVKFYEKGGKGIVNYVFTNEKLQQFNGHMGIGHVRYSTQGGAGYKNAQPLGGTTKNGTIYLAHNGQFANSHLIRRKLQNEGVIFMTTSDTEVALHQFARSNGATIIDKMRDALKGINPSYALLALTNKEVIAVRDPAGIKPLVIGELPDGGIVFSSETVPFQALNAKYVGEVQPGEMVIADKDGLHCVQLFPKQESQQCIFEQIYFGHPASFIFGSKVTVGEVRKEFGRMHYKLYPTDGDVVIPVPDSSNQAALGYSQDSGIPFGFGLIRSHYIGRTFIQPRQIDRDAGVLKKYTIDETEVRGKRVIVVDDSLVRGTTLKKLVIFLREMGAKEIHVRITSPPYAHSCYLGIDTAETGKLLAANKTVDGIRQYIDADSLVYFSTQDLLSNKYLTNKYCTFCFDGQQKILRH
jgi:amidophosphoribosyltransferase